MTETENKALVFVNEVRTDRGWSPNLTLSEHDCSRTEALCRAIEQHEAFRQEVSDAVERAVDDCGHDGLRKAYVHARFFHFIIPKTDPLVEVISSALREGSPFDEDGSHDYTAEAKVIAAAIEARGGRIVWEGE